MITKNKRVRFIAMSLPVLAFGLLFLTGEERAMLNSSSAGFQKPIVDERKAEIGVPHQIPVRLTDVRNLQNEDWLKDLEIEVQNTSTKPIYCLVVYLRFPDIPETTEVDGIPRGYIFMLLYGRLELLNRAQIATSEDVPIKPGERYIFKIPESQWKGLKSELTRRNISESVIKRVWIQVPTLIFGDGSGFRNRIPVPAKQTSNNYQFQELRSRTPFNNVVASMNSPLAGNLNIPLRVKATILSASKPRDSCGPALSGCRRYNEVNDQCPSGGPCFKQFYLESSGGTCYGQIDHTTLPCEEGGVNYTCVFDTGYTCEETIACGTHCPTKDCYECEHNLGGVWRSNGCYCDTNGVGGNGCSLIEQEDCESCLRSDSQLWTSITERRGGATSMAICFGIGPKLVTREERILAVGRGTCT